MAKNQLGRRNLMDFAKGELTDTIEELEKEKGKKTQGIRTDLLSTIDKKLEPKHNTQKIVSEKLGWSTGKKAMFDVVKRESTRRSKSKIKNW